MRKGLLLTDRDIDLLKYLAHGAAFSEDLHLRFFVRTAQRIAPRTFRARMQKLVEGECIQVVRPQRVSFRNRDKHGPVYALTKKGAEVLVNEGCMNVDRIRIVHLDRRSIEHEIILTRLIRKIYEFDVVRYTVVRLYDDLMLSKLAQKYRLDRIPDLYFTVQLKNGAYFNFLVEVDASTTHAPEFLRKLLTFTQSRQSPVPIHSKEPFGILIVCNTESRMIYLQRIVMDSPHTSKLRSLFAFNTIFGIDNSQGLFNSWWKADGSKIDLIFKAGNRPEKAPTAGSVQRKPS